LEKNAAVGRQWEAPSIVIPTIHGVVSVDSLYRQARKLVKIGQSGLLKSKTVGREGGVSSSFTVPPSMGLLMALAR
jgi:hypothetical protein